MDPCPFGNQSLRCPPFTPALQNFWVRVDTRLRPCWLCTVHARSLRHSSPMRPQRQNGKRGILAICPSWALGLENPPPAIVQLALKRGRPRCLLALHWLGGFWIKDGASLPSTTTLLPKYDRPLTEWRPTALLRMSDRCLSEGAIRTAMLPDNASYASSIDPCPNWNCLRGVAILLFRQ